MSREPTRSLAWFQDQFGTTNLEEGVCREMIIRTLINLCVLLVEYDKEKDIETLKMRLAGLLANQAAICNYLGIEMDLLLDIACTKLKTRY